jgi:hypothetical protein
MRSKLYGTAQGLNNYLLPFPYKQKPYTKEVGARGGAIFEALRYKPEGRGIDS